MSTTTAIKVTMAYSDANSRTYSIDDVGTVDVASVKAAITAFNQAASIEGSNVKKTFVSDEGAPVTSITQGRIVQTTEEVLYNG